MARNRDLPGWPAAVHLLCLAPHRAEMALAIVVSVLVLTVDLRGVIGSSSFAVLGYYAIANASVFTQDEAPRRWVHVVGLLGRLVLVTTLPCPIVVGLAVSVASSAASLSWLGREP